ncbi:MAG: hypothetical protein GHHEDOFH_00704 [Pseudorhodoplanes sp.]|nr:hypothetical protein [Pseudorhodoplanes sp.]
MFAFEIVGAVLLALFFVALVDYRPHEEQS